MTQEQQPSVLIFAPYFPPRKRVGAIRPYRFAKHLNKMGWRVTVMCIHSKGTLDERTSAELEGVEILSLKPPLDRTESSTSKSSSKKASSASESKLTQWFDQQFPLDTWWPFFRAKRNEIEEHIHAINPDIIWSTSDPWSGGYVIGQIAVSMNKPWVADFRDPWTLCDVRFPKKGKLAQWFEKKAERWMMKHADHVTFTAHKTATKYKKQYPKLDASVIYNSFDLDHFDQQKTHTPEVSNKLRVLFLGAFRDLSNAELILNVLEKAMSINEEVAKCIEIHSYAALTGADKEKAENLGVTHQFIVRDKVPVTQVPQEINQADVLLLSTQPDRTDIIPAKLWDYLPAEKPIISLVQNSEVKEILLETDRGEQFDIQNLEAAANQLIRYAEGRLKGNDVPSRPGKTEVISTYDAKQRAAELSTVLKKVIDHVG